MEDRPEPFGYKSTWLAIPVADTQSVVMALRLQEVRPAKWAEGIAESYQGEKVYVTPPLAGWTLVVGDSLPYAGDGVWIPFLLKLSETLGSVQFFATHRVVEYHAWARAEHGQLIRAYAFIGESGETLFDIGDPTQAETQVGLKFSVHSAQPVLVSPWEPNEEVVINIAGRWSINPLELDSYASEGSGALGKLNYSLLDK